MHAQRTSVMKKDMDLARRLRGDKLLDHTDSRTAEQQEMDKGYVFSLPMRGGKKEFNECQKEIWGPSEP